MFYFNPQAFADNLIYMLCGMLGIFAVIGVIILSTIILNICFKAKK